jgi:glutamyl-tRNA(Gln) amidotransferase subunit E
MSDSPNSESKIDWKKIGLRVGLEIHQQLKTKRKLFCECPLESEVGDKIEFERRLRPTRSELGEVDIAAFFEWKKGRKYHYISPNEASCLVEADEEPPHAINKEAVVISLAMALALGSIPVDEIHVMRKIGIDGSNTSGFQRTDLVAMGGSVTVDGKEFGIQTICVEEDAAKKEGEEKNITYYNLERLGIPLIEISTAPDITEPEEAEKVALTIGQMLRMTGKVRRGIGTIRQDLNVSIKNGEKIEIKGVQDLSLLPKVVEYEAIRQLNLLKIREELKKRGLSKENTGFVLKDVTRILCDSNSKIVRKNLSKPGGKALALKLIGMKGILGTEVQPGRRFGTELADYARFWGDVKGLFHSDELPGYGITIEEVTRIKESLGMGENDAFVLIVDEEEKARNALDAVKSRVIQAFEGVPRETRTAMPDGTTKFMRPQPGSARMYPETDIPLLPVTKNLLEEAESIKPLHPQEKLREYINLGLSEDLAKQVLKHEKMDLIDHLIREYGAKIKPKTIASIIVSHLKALKRDGVQIEKITDQVLEKAFELLADGRVSREGLDKLFELSASHPGEDLEKLAEKHGLLSLSYEEIEEFIDKVILENREEILRRGDKAVPYIMGKVMAELRGRVPGKLVAEIVRKKVIDEKKKLAK